MTNRPSASPTANPASQTQPTGRQTEFTLRSTVLAIALASILAGANAYLGLFAGMTVSASIPAAVLSMAILRWFRDASILENNLVQTAASSGEALAAGVIFTVPALVLLNAWEHFDYWSTVTVSLIGGTLGVLFTIPLRRALVGNSTLPFPEGVATAEVLKTGLSPGPRATAIRPLAIGAGFGAAMKIGESGLRLWTDSVEGAAHIGRTLIYGGVNLSPALIAVGFIIGFPTALVMFVGGLLGWVMVLPLEAWIRPSPSGQDALQAAQWIWSHRVRYVGIGAMLVGGLWTLLQIRGPIWSSLTRLFQGDPNAQAPHEPGKTPWPDTAKAVDRDTPGLVLLLTLLACLVATFFVYHQVVQHSGVAWLMTVLMVTAAFVFSSVAGYMAGLVGSSSNPVSGVTIATIMLTAGLLLVVLGAGHPNGPAATLLIAAVVCCAAAIGGDNLQDLKTGQLVGATPWKQQGMQMIGVVTGALTLPPVLTLLHAKYGIGAPTVEHPHPLTAPQATLMAHLSEGMFTGALPWDLVTLGAILAWGIILLDRRLSTRSGSIRLPVLAVALGIYLPFKLTSAVMLGGLIHLVAISKLQHRPGGQGAGLLMAAGLITGEALLGIVLAIPVALASFWPSLGADPLRLVDVPPLGPWPGALILAGIAYWLYRISRS